MIAKLKKQVKAYQPINADGNNACGLTVKFGGPLVIGTVSRKTLTTTQKRECNP